MRKFKKTTLVSMLFISPYLIYLVAVNLLLVGHILPPLVSEGKGKSFNLNYTGAWSLWPGRIKIQGLHLNGTDPNVEWNVRISSTSIRLRLAELFNKKINSRQLIGNGVSLDVIQHGRPKPPPDPNAESNPSSKSKSPWMVDLEGIELNDVNDLKVGGMHIENVGKITGAFTLKPGQFLELKPSTLQLAHGKLSSGREKPKPILDDLEAFHTITIHPTDLSTTHGNQIFDTIDIDQTLKAKILSAEFLALALKDYRPLLFGESEGTLNTQLKIKKGELQTSSNMNAQLLKTQLVFSGAQIEGTGSLTWEVEQDAKMTFQLDQAVWKDEKGKDLAKTQHFKMLGFSKSLKLPTVFSDLILKLNIKDVSVGSLQRLLKHVMGYNGEKSLLLESRPGSFSVTGSITPSKNDFSGDLVYSAPEFKWSHDAGKTVLQSYLRTELNVASKDYNLGKFNFNAANLKFTSLKIFSEGKEEYSTDRWEMKTSLKHGAVSLIGTFELTGDLHMAMTNAKVPARYAAPDSFWMPIALFFFPMKHFKGEGKLEVKSDRFSLTHFTSVSSSGKLSADLVSLENDVEGAILLQLAPLTACILIDPTEKTKIEVNHAKEKCTKQSAEILEKT